MNLRTIASEIFHHTLTAIDVTAVVRQALQRDGNLLTVCGTTYDTKQFARLLVIAVGKASLPMAHTAEQILGDLITTGIVATNESAHDHLQKLQIFIGGHPLPKQSSIDAAEAALALLRANNDEKTLVLFLLSGGGSALFEKPIDDAITLEDLQTINRVLVGCGAVINEMNVVRKFLSAVKGGRLAEAAHRATQISLYISDVNSDDLSTVSSGLTLPSNITTAEVNRIVTKYDLLDKFPAHVAAISKEKLPHELPTAEGQTPNHSHHLLLDNRAALQTAQKIAEQNYNCVVEIAEDLVEGEVEEMSRIHLERLQTLHKNNPGKIVCLLSGGEVICPVRGNGQGGRNQEFVLRTMLNSANILGANFPFTVLSAGTDGIDGHSPAAGAIADENSLARAAAQNLAPEDYLERSDSYNFFHALHDALITGPTGNNVRDLRILLARS